MVMASEGAPVASERWAWMVYATESGPATSVSSVKVFWPVTPTKL